MRYSKVFGIFVVTIVTSVALLLTGCKFSINPFAQSPSPDPEPIDETATDQMFNDYKEGVELDFVVYNEQAVLVPSGESLSYNFAGEIKEGHFYRAIANVNYLNGGIAGYYNYPDVQSVTSLEEVPGSSIDMPSIREKSYGVLRLDGYADADYLLNEYGQMAVLSGDEWIYTYDKSEIREDETMVLFKDGTSEETIEKGIADGIVCCEDFFLVPAAKE